jgi:tRNA(Arg) A34 adenosine deaminase TadA
MDHEPHVRRVLDLARTAVDEGNYPFGALLVADGEVVASSTNTVATDWDITAHPELKLAVLASERYDLERRRELTLYASTEPCPMCAGAIYWAGIGRVVFSTSAATVAEHSGDDLVIPVPCEQCLEGAGREIEFVGPLLEEEGLEVHREFWAAGEFPDSPAT